MRISDWSSDVCSSDLPIGHDRIDLDAAVDGPRVQHDRIARGAAQAFRAQPEFTVVALQRRHQTLTHALALQAQHDHRIDPGDRSEEHTSELQSLMRISYAVFCLKKKKHNRPHNQNTNQLPI